MNATEMRKLTEAAQAAEDAEWWSHGISDIKEAIQNAAKAERRFYKRSVTSAPDFVVEYFKNLGFEVGVIPSGSIYGNLELTISW